MRSVKRSGVLKRKPKKDDSSKKEELKGDDLELFNSILSDSELYDDLVERRSNVNKYDSQYLRNLQREHAIRYGKYREFELSTCPKCKNVYHNFSYFSFLIQNNINLDVCIKMFTYENFNLKCCLEFAETYKSPDGGPLVKFEPKEKLILPILKASYLLTQGYEKELIISKCKITESELNDILQNYEVPSIDETMSKLLFDWMNSTQEIEIINIDSKLSEHILVNKDLNDLEIDRNITFLKECSSCGYPTTYAYLFFLMVTLFDINREEFFLDFQILAPCCRMNYLTPTMKPITYVSEKNQEKIPQRLQVRQGDDVYIQKGKKKTKPLTVKYVESPVVKKTGAPKRAARKIK